MKSKEEIAVAAANLRRHLEEAFGEGNHTAIVGSLVKAKIESAKLYVIETHISGLKPEELKLFDQVWREAEAKRL